MKYVSDPVRIECEISLVWAKDYPVLFAKSFIDFFGKYSAGHKIESKVKKGFITLIAHKEQS